MMSEAETTTEHELLIEDTRFSPTETKAMEALKMFADDLLNIRKRTDLGEKEKQYQISLSGLVLYDSLPQTLTLDELTKVLGVRNNTVDGWIRKNLLSPSQEERREIVVGNGFQIIPQEPLISDFIFNRDEMLNSLLLATSSKFTALSRKDYLDIIKDPDWSSKSTNLEWIGHFLVNKSKWKEYFMDS